LTVLKIRHNDLSTVLRQSPSFVNSVDSTGRTALAWAAHREDSYAVKKLLDYGADSSLGDQCGVVPLHLAAENRTVKCLEVLLAQDADVDQMDIHGRTAAHYACEYQSPVDGETEAMLRILRDRGADILRADRYGRTGLHKSAAVGNVGGLVFFLHHGCDKDKLDDWGKSALVDTIKRNQHKALAELLKYDSGRFEGLGVNNDHTLLHILADDADLQTLQMVYRARLAGINTRKLDGQSRAAQDIFDNRVPPPEPDLTETWYMLLMQLEGDDLTDGTSSEKSWIYEDALEEQHTIISEAKRVYGLEHV
jgi:ankyrin repeat protein